MSDIFISYARPNEPLARKASEALRAAGYNVWRDDELPAHRAYSDVIEERIKGAKAVLVLWSNEAVKSQWVRAEADAARELGTLVQVSIDGVLPPMPFNQIQCADLFGWTGDVSWQGWTKVESSIASLAGAGPADLEATASHSGERRAAVCVLPFLNMSGDAEQEYFSDGISEDIITDLSKVSALSVVARNTAFTFKGKAAEVLAVARQLNVTHVLEGSVRKAGQRVRITAQLVDGKTGDPVWGDRYDRDLTDIFAIQDEISKAIVGALKLKLLPQEKKAIERRGTSNSDAYNLYLLARRHWIDGTHIDPRRAEMVIRMAKQAVAVDPSYGQAWALMALAQANLRFWHGRSADALEAAERALSIDPNLAEPYCVKAHYLQSEGRIDEANGELAKGLALDADSWEVNKEMAFLTFRQKRVADSIPFFEKAASLMDDDYHNAGMLVTCYAATGDRERYRIACQTTLARAERAVAHDPSNAHAMAMGATALAGLGDAERTREWVDRAMLIDPDNILQGYNLSCALVTLGEHAAAIDLLGPYFEQASWAQFSHTEADPDIDPLRDDARYQAMVAAARARLDAEAGAPVSA